MNKYKMVIDKHTRFVIMYNNEVIRKFWSLTDARDFLDYAENYERNKATMGAKV